VHVSAAGGDTQEAHADNPKTKKKTTENNNYTASKLFFFLWSSFVLFDFYASTTERLFFFSVPHVLLCPDVRMLAWQEGFQGPSSAEEGTGGVSTLFKVTSYTRPGKKRKVD
jgi:hypothetical protein